MIEGMCPKCKQKYYGWALLKPDNDRCDCGYELFLTEDGRRLIKV